MGHWLIWKMFLNLSIKYNNTIKFMKRLSLLFCSLFLITNFLQSQSPARTGKDYAYFFYVSEFQPGWGPLPETKEAVTKIANELEQNFGFKTKIIPNPTKKEIKDWIKKINKNRYGQDDQVLFFFSAHGHFDPDTDRGYFIPTDGKYKDEYGDSWLSYDDLGSWITASSCPHILLALDACYSGSFGDRYMDRPIEKPWEGELDCRGKTKFALAKDTRYYFTSGSRGQKTPVQSLFAKRWLNALYEGAEKEVLLLNDLKYHFGTIEYPKPEGGTFTSKDQGGDFVFVHKNACRNRTLPNNVLSKDNAHWEDCLEKKSLEIVIEHMRIYPDCHHHRTALDLLEKIKPPTNNTNTVPSPNNMVFIKGGTFQMGSEDKDTGLDEKPAHEVTIDDFYIGRFEVTVAEFEEFIDNTNYKTDADKEGSSYIWKSDTWKEQTDINWQYDAMGKHRSSRAYNHPVIHISWYDAVAYCNWLSEEQSLQKVYTIEGTEVTINLQANGYRLPTEAEWEYAARSRGKNDVWAGTSTETHLLSYGNYGGNGDGFQYTAPVGSFDSNASGLYDMSGNVWEWCWDWYDNNFYSKSKNTVNPIGSNSGNSRVLKGGSWVSKPTKLRCAYRYDGRPSIRSYGIGFRLSQSAK